MYGINVLCRQGSNMYVVCVIQARVGSTRLPGKVLKVVKGKPLIEYVIDRIAKSKYIDKIVLVTGRGEENYPLEGIAKHKGISFYAGSEDDVLDRYYQAAKNLGAKAIVRITGDCPLIDYQVSDKVIKHYLENTFDYVSNFLPRSYPKGLDTEIFSFKVLAKSWKLAKTPYEREHVTPFIRYSGLFTIGNVAYKEDLQKTRWTVDTPEDFIRVSKIINHFSGYFNMEDMLKYEKESN